jgi:Fe2+ or Zn2+ uptake regulation protein
MTKKEVLQLFSRISRPVKPDEICGQLVKSHHRSSVYSYLRRLHRQGLLNRHEIGGRIAYSISDRGIERLEYFKSQKELS